MKIPSALSMADASRDGRVSRATLYREIADGKLKTYKIRNRRLIDADEWSRYVRELRRSRG